MHSESSRPGQKMSMGFSWKYMRPSEIMLPQEGVSVPMPAPRKERMASVTMAEAQI